MSLRTNSEVKATKFAVALSDRLERLWGCLRMEMIYSRELGLNILQDANPTVSDKCSLSDALALYHRLKGGGKTQLFFDVSIRSIRYLQEWLGHNDLAAMEIKDAGQFRDHLFSKGMSSSSVKRRSMP